MKRITWMWHLRCVEWWVLLRRFNGRKWPNGPDEDPQLDPPQ